MLYHSNLSTQWCRRTGGNKGDCQGEIKYLNWSGPMCQKHAQQVCDSFKPGPGQDPMVMPQPIELDTSLPEQLTPEVLRDRLKLVTRSHGGCPEEGVPDDTTIMLVFGDEVISEVRL